MSRLNFELWQKSGYCTTMDAFKDWMAHFGRDEVEESRNKVERIKQKLAQEEAHLQNLMEHQQLRDARIAEFFCNITLATTMPARGALFVDPDISDPSSKPDTTSERWHELGFICVVADPAYGFGLRIAATSNSLIWNGRTGYEYKAGDVLEFLGVGTITDLKIGDQVTIRGSDMRDNCVLSIREDASRVLDARNSFISKNHTPTTIVRRGIGGEWPPVSGRVISIEPRCSAYTLPKGSSVLDEAAAAKMPLEYFALSRMFLPVTSSEIKAAKKGK